MRAVAVPAFREPPVEQELPEPAPRRGELRVRMDAAGVNPFDWKILDGILSPRRPHRFPLVAGVDGAGVVDALGDGTKGFRLGDRVMGQFLHDPVGDGTYAEVTTVPQENAVRKIPDTVDAATAAALPMAGMTAMLAVETVGAPPGSDLILVGATGGVGSFVLQLASSAGVRVTAVARGEGVEAVRRMGAAHAVDASLGDLPVRLRELHPAGVAGLIDVVSDGPTFAELASLVRKGGVAATSVFVANPEALAPLGIRAVNLDLQPTGERLERVLREVVAGRLNVPVRERIRLSDAPRALSESRAGRSRGKVVIALR